MFVIGIWRGVCISKAGCARLAVVTCDQGLRLETRMIICRGGYTYPRLPIGKLRGGVVTKARSWNLDGVTFEQGLRLETCGGHL